MNYRLLYFASLADAAGCAQETMASVATTPRELFDDVRARHALGISHDRLRVAVNGALVAWTHVLVDGDEIVFLPPVSGG